MGEENLGAVLVLAIIFAIVVMLIRGAFVYFLWNWMMPTLFGLVSLTYWQAIGLFVLAQMLFAKVDSPET